MPQIQRAPPVRNGIGHCHSAVNFRTQMLLVAPVTYPPCVGISDVQDLYEDGVPTFIHRLLKGSDYNPTKIKIPKQIEAYAENHKT